MLKPFREHLPTVKAVTAKALYDAMAVLTFSSGQTTKCRKAYIFNISIGSGWTRLSRLEDVSESGSFRSSNAVRVVNQDSMRQIKILTISHEYAKSNIKIRLS